MTTLLKRKMGPSENIFMSHALDSVTEAAVSGPKKSMKMEQPVRGRGQGDGGTTGGSKSGGLCIGSEIGET